MDADSMRVTIRGMIAQNPVDMTFSGETHEVGEGNMEVSERQMKVGLQPSYQKSFWLIKSDWTTLPVKKDTVTVNGTIFRVLDYKDYYMDVARRLDVGSRYEPGRGE